MRACLRSCRVNGPRCAVSSIGADVSVSVTVCVLKRLISWCRVWHRLQSPHRIGFVAGRGDGASTGGGDGPSIGRRRALTRRGCLVSFPCPKHCSRSGQARQSPMRAAYTRRTMPSCSVRRSCGESGWFVGQRRVPSGCGTKSVPATMPTRLVLAHSGAP